jgi:gallate dioxygenase
MAKIIGAVASSHSPTIGFAFDTNKQNDPVWAPIFKGYEPVQQWLAEKKPDVLFLIFNDHVTSFFFDHYSQFALGVGEEYRTADEGGGPRKLPPIKGHPKLAAHIAAGFVADEFDLSFFQDKGLDHGCFSPLSILLPHDATSWPTKMIPMQIGVLQTPSPNAKRCYKLGQSLRRAIESYPEDLKVAIVATGGLSHQVHGERCGFNNTEWDMKFLDLLVQDPEQLTNMTIAQYATLGGWESAEVVMWLIMRGAMAPKIKKLHQSYYLPSMTALATAIYEDDGPAESVDPVKMRERMNHELVGAEKLQGTYPFTLEMSVKAYRLNKFLHDLVDPAHREKFLKEPEKAFEEAHLTEHERDMVRRRAWIELIQYGVIFFLLEKLGAVIGVSNPHIYASMRGMSLEDFQKTRNQQIQYSVAGDSKQMGFDKKN